MVRPERPSSKLIWRYWCPRHGGAFRTDRLLVWHVAIAQWLLGFRQEYRSWPTQLVAGLVPSYSWP